MTPALQSAMKETRRYRTDVLRSAEENHIWLNAFGCIRPTDEFKLQLADVILRMLADPESLIEMEPIGTLRQKCLVLRINKS